MEIISSKLDPEQVLNDSNDKLFENLQPESHKRLIAYYKTHVLRITMHAHILLALKTRDSWYWTGNTQASWWFRLHSL